MEKETGRITFSETEDGFRVEVTGESLKKALSSCCCMPFFVRAQQDSTDCCSPRRDETPDQG